MVLFNHTYKDANWNMYKSNEIIVIWIIQNDKQWDKAMHGTRLAINWKFIKGRRYVHATSLYYYYFDFLL